MSKPELIVSTSPHIRRPEDISQVMGDVLFALMPATAVGALIFGSSAFWVILTCLVTSVFSEAIIQKLMKRKITVLDGSALVTGLLLALNLPSGIPLWMAAVGAGIAIGLGKQIYGGLGHNPFNPALLARVVLLISWPAQMTRWPAPLTWGIDATTAATPLGVLKDEGFHRAIGYYYEILAFPDKADLYWGLFIGDVGGCIGETSALALLVGGIYLLWKGRISWPIPVTYLLTVFILTTIFWFKNPSEFADPLFHILSGGLMIGAFFMATDMVTSPITPRGKIIFGIGCGILTVIIRLFGGYPEGVSFSILLMNGTTFLIDRWKFTHPKKFGGR